MKTAPKHVSTNLRTIAISTQTAEQARILQEGLSGNFILQNVVLGDAATATESQASQSDACVIVMDSIDSDFITEIRAMLDVAPKPVLVFVREDTNKLAKEAIRNGVSSFVVDGLEPNRLPTLVDIATERFELFDALQKELARSQERLAARKTVEQAKGLVMQHRNMTEQQAYKTLRDMAMRQGKPLKLVAENVISMSELLP